MTQGVCCSRDKVRIALVGLDHWYTSLPFAERIAKGRDAELVAVWDRCNRRAREVASGTSAVLPENWESVLEGDAVDAVAVFGTVADNGRVVEAAVSAGKHVICGKPVAMTVSEIESVAKAAQRTGVVVFPMEGYYRLTSHCGHLRNLVRQASVGDIRTVSIVGRAGVPQSWSDDSSPGWYGDPLKVPGGAWIDHGIYQLAFVRWLLGQEPVRVRGKVANLGTPGISNEDYGLAVYEFSGETLVSLEETWTLPRGMYQFQIDLVGTEGVVSYGNRDSKMWIARPGRKPIWVEDPFEEKPVDYFRHFIECIRGCEQPVCNLEDAQIGLAASLAFYEAAEKGIEIDIQI